MKQLLLFIFLACSSLIYAQLPSEEIVESNKFNCDARILLHYSNEEILAMDSVKFDMIKYYYCDSYILDTSNVTNFNINTFDISVYEHYRENDKDVLLQSGDLVIRLIARKELLYEIINNPSNSLNIKHRKQ